MGKRKKKEEAKGEFLVCRNPKALKVYEVEERVEAGMVLAGSEVKSLRGRQADLEGAYAAFGSLPPDGLTCGDCAASWGRPSAGRRK